MDTPSRMARSVFRAALFSALAAHGLGCEGAESSGESTTHTCASSTFEGFAAPVAYPAGAAAIALATLDLDSDGHLDLAVANDGTANSYVTLLRGLGDGTFEAAGSHWTKPGARTIVAANLSDDPRTDLVVATSDVSTVPVLLNKGDGTLSSTLFFADKRPYGIAVADLDGDGRLDLSVANNGAGVSVLLASGDGTFGLPVQYKVAYGPMSIAAVDLDNDGDVDLAVANMSGILSLLTNNGDGTFVSAGTQNVGVEPVGTDILYELDQISIVAADWNGDGWNDLAMSTSASAEVTLLLGKGGGDHEDPVRYDAGIYAYSMASADMDGDGKTDLVVSGPWNDQVSVLTNTGGGVFGAPALYEAGDLATGVVAADLNEDGSLDLAVTNPIEGTVSVLLGACRP